MSFADHFSAVAPQYAAGRPHYPAALFQYLAQRAPDHELVWDVGCGSGQAAVGLSDYFAHVIATDASARQLVQTERRANISYMVGTESMPTLGDHTVDLVTVAQAVHWFDRTRFYAEVARVLRPRGVLAMWTYDLCEIAPDVDAALLRWYRETLGPWWPSERRHVETRYRDIGFPYPQFEVPEFFMTLSWTRAQLELYLRTWSAVQEHDTRTGGDALAILRPALHAAWPDEHEVRTVRWPLTVLVGQAQR